MPMLKVVTGKKSGSKTDLASGAEDLPLKHLEARYPNKIGFVSIGSRRDRE